MSIDIPLTYLILGGCLLFCLVGLYTVVRLYKFSGEDHGPGIEDLEGGNDYETKRN